MNFLSGLIDKKTEKIINIFLKNPNEFYHINKVSIESKVPLSTTFRIINKLVKNDFLEIKYISKFKIYKLKENEKTKKLKLLFDKK
ncbi:MAG: hypothetical protein QXE31_02125 [Candidatus Woesearchaeota archaeon]